MTTSGAAAPFTLRTELRPGDIGHVVQRHGLIYAREHGWDATFEAYVARALAEFALRHDPERERMWLAEDAQRIVGSIAIVNATDDAGADDAQLRWFLVEPDCRGRGLGTRLIGEALSFCRASGRRRVHLWTVRGLDAAARLYAKAGFAVAESVAGERWGASVVEERWQLVLR